MEHALRAILADFFLGGDQGFQFGDLHRLVRLRAATTARLNLGKDLVVTDPLQRGFDRCPSALITKLIKILDDIEEAPRRIDGPAHDFIPLRKRNHAHQLREVGVRCRADQQPARLPACLFCERPEPGPRAIAQSECAVLQQRCLRHAAFRLAALAPHPDLGQVTAGAALVHEQLALLLEAVRGSVMREGVPVDVTDVARAAGSHESYWNHRSPLLIPVDELPPGERLPVDQQARPPASGLTLLILRDEPLRELESGNPGGRRRWIVISRWWRLQIHRGHIEDPRQLLAQPWLRNRLPAQRPKVQAGNQYGVVRQIHHRSGPERGHELALADFALGLVPSRHTVSSSRSAFSRVLTQIFTSGSTSRRDRLARNFMRG